MFSKKHISNLKETYDNEDKSRLYSILMPSIPLLLLLLVKPELERVDKILP